MSVSAENPLTVLIPSGAGAPGFAGIVRCLRAESAWRIVAGDTNEFAYGRVLCDDFAVITGSDDEAGYLRDVEMMVERYGVEVILPITTRELGILSGYRDRFALRGVKVVVSSAEAIGVSNDKGLTAAVARDLGLPVPEFVVCGDLAEFEMAVKDLQLRHERVCFKPVEGNGSRGFGIVEKALRKGEFLKGKAGIMPLSLEEWKLRLPGVFDVPLMVSAFVGGVEYSVDMLCEGGKTLFCVPRTRDKMIGGISVAGRLDRNFGLIAFCIRLAQALELDGPIGMQWREDAEGVPHLLEINPRLQGTTSALELMGLNLPVQAVRLAVGWDLTQGMADIVWGDRFVRFWDERVVE